MIDVTYKAPEVRPGEATPQFVRDQLLLCFESANREFASLLNQPVTDEQLKSQVKSFVESVFAGCGVSYADPTKQGILTAISQCRANAEKMMGPKGAEIIQHHYEEMMKVISRLPD
jgi:hypothetical protein